MRAGNEVAEWKKGGKDNRQLQLTKAYTVCATIRIECLFFYMIFGALNLSSNLHEQRFPHYSPSSDLVTINIFVEPL